MSLLTERHLMVLQTITKGDKMSGLEIIIIVGVLYTIFG